MPRRPTVNTPKVLRMLFEGKSGSEIASACLVTEMSVSNVKKAFIREAERGGLMKAAQAHGIGETVNDLINLQKSVNSIEGGFSSVKKGIEYGKSFENMKVEPQDVSRWIEDVYEAARNDGLEGDEVGHLLHRFSEVVGESGLGYEETLGAMDDANQRRIEDEAKNHELKAEIEHLKEEKVKADDDVKVALDVKGLTQEKLDIYTGALSSINGKVSLDDTVVLSNLVKRLVMEKKPYGEIVAFYGRGLDLDKEREEKTAQISTLDRSRQDLEGKVKETRDTLDANKDTMAVLESWKEAGLSPKRGVALMGKVVEYAALNGLSKEEALSGFYSDLEENWEPSLGFGNEYHMLSAKVDALKLELSNTQGLLKETKRAYDSTMSAVEAKGALNRRGVGDDELIAWDKVLSECGTDVQSFRDEMNNLGGIKTKVEKMRTEERKAEERLALLQSKVSAENETYKQFRAANEAFREHFDNVVNPLLQNVKMKMDELEAKMLDDETGIEPQMESVITKATGQFQATVNTGVDDVSSEIKTLIDRVKQGETDFVRGVRSSISLVDKAVTTWEAEKEKTLKEFYELGEGVQRYKILADVLSVIRGEEPDVFIFTFSFVALLDAVEVYYSKNMPSLKIDVMILKNKLQEGLEHSQFSLK